MFAYVLSLHLSRWLGVDGGGSDELRDCGTFGMTLLEAASTLEADDATRSDEPLPTWTNGHRKPLEAWQRWQSRLTTLCLGNSWIVSSSQNRVVAPFALFRALCVLDLCANQRDRQLLDRLMRFSEYTSPDTALAFSRIDAYFASLWPGTAAVSGNSAPSLLTHTLFYSSDMNVTEKFDEAIMRSRKHWVHATDFANPTQLIAETSTTSACKLDEIRKTLTGTSVSAATRLILVAGMRLRTSWLNHKASPHADGPFLCAYGTPRTHPFFILRGPAISIPLAPLSSSNTQLEVLLAIVRPNLVGDMAQLVARMDFTEKFWSLLDTSKAQQGCVLLPRMYLNSLNASGTPIDLRKYWKAGKKDAFKNLPGFSDETHVGLDHFFHCATFSIDERGIGFDPLPVNAKASHTFTSTRASSMGTAREHNPIGVRIDSPFLVLLVERHTRTPLIVGSYGGRPPVPLSKLRRPHMSKGKAKQPKDHWKKRLFPTGCCSRCSLM
ncbi:hypothetical protein AAVH_09224 [Aphelenchoides avenae]|nr:hypothetical protein AAVH_09224 [Aphelenchus avenae]